MEQALKLVQQLVKDFQSNESYYLQPEYQEIDVRRDFIDKFFAALGWDVTHELQRNPYQQEVRVERNVEIKGTQKRADYAFFVAPNFRDVKFFVEAKKPSRNLSNAQDYFQTIRYGYNQKTPIAILTDFEELHILDCRFTPDIATALTRKLKSFRYNEYADEEKLKEIFYLFGRDEVLKGSIDNYVSTLSRPRGAAQVLFKKGFLPIDEAFLIQLDQYRENLAKAFKKENPDLQSEEITEAVQRTLDRLVFIRFLEDKLIVNEKYVESIAVNPKPWNSFLSACKELEPKYNGMVFKPHPVIESEHFKLKDDRIFAEICSDLSNPASPYDFDQIPISILGSIYERFLGKVIHATDKRVKVEEKPEVRKAGGVYYTPEYIVRYIVSNTVGKLIEEKTPEEISKMAFADIACGSGSFLIEVYSDLLDYHTRYYTQNTGAAKTGDTQIRDGKTVLSLKKKKEILLNNIYGVDIDFQAVEVTQFSLYLKLLEDVTTHEAYQYGLLKEAILPDLKRNIVCGNSLIGTDILEGDLFDEEQKKKLNPMDFEATFPEIMNPSRGSGCGFDAIVGNPPYGADLSRLEKNYIGNKYPYVSDFETSQYFIAKAYEVIKKEGYVCYIVPNTMFLNLLANKFRRFVSSSFRIEKLANLSEIDVFQTAKVRTAIPFLIRSDERKSVIEFFGFEGENKQKLICKIEQDKLLLDDKAWISGFIEPAIVSLKQKIMAIAIPLNDILEISQGLIPYDKYRGHDEYTIKNRIWHGDKKKDKTYKKELRGGDVIRYSVNWNGKQWISYGPWLAAPRKPEFFNEPRLLFREITDTKSGLLNVAYTKEEYYNNPGIINCISRGSNYSLLYILGIVNSRLISYLHFSFSSKARKGIFPKILVDDVRNLPIKKINFSDPKDKPRYGQIVKLVEQMLEAKEKLPSAKLDSERTHLEMKITDLDRQIDQAVYELYRLTEKEIKVVEGK